MWEVSGRQAKSTICWRTRGSSMLVRRSSYTRRHRLPRSEMRVIRAAVVIHRSPVELTVLGMWPFPAVSCVATNASMLQSIWLFLQETTSSWALFFWSSRVITQRTSFLLRFKLMTTPAVVLPVCASVWVFSIILNQSDSLVYITERREWAWPLRCLWRRISGKSSYFHSDSVPHAGSITAANTPVLSGSVPAVKAAPCLQIFLWLAESLSEQRSSKQSRTRLRFHLVDKSRRTFMRKPLRSPSSWNWTQRCWWWMQELTTIVWQWNVHISVFKHNSL